MLTQMSIRRAWRRPDARATVIVLLLASSGWLAAAQSPDTPAVRQLTGWLEAFNSGTREAMAEFLQKNFPAAPPERVDQQMRFRAQTGGFDLKKIEEATTTRVVALAKERLSDQFARLTFDVDAAEPNDIIAMAMRAVDPPAGFAPPHLSAGDLTVELRKKVESEVAADRFAGALLWAHQGKTIFSGAYGQADREHNVANTPQTRFRIGSMNKMFTATATMQLVQAGKVKLDDPVGKYITDYPDQAIATKVTIAQLLTHTGGTGDIFGREFDAHRTELRTLQDYLKLYGGNAPRFEPGSRWEYSNYGFILLGVVIERVTGTTYYEYVHDHIYVPAGMTATASEPEDVAVPNRSIGYMRMGPGATGYRPNTDTLPYRGTSAGGGYSTVADLARFASALQQHKLLDAHDTELMTTGKVDAGGGRYAYGFGDRTINGTRCFGHNGGAPGMNGELEICPAGGDVVAVLSNLDPPAAGRLAEFIVNRLPSATPAAAR